MRQQNRPIGHELDTVVRDEPVLSIQDVCYLDGRVLSSVVHLLTSITSVFEYDSNVFMYKCLKFVLDLITVHLLRSNLKPLNAPKYQSSKDDYSLIL